MDGGDGISSTGGWGATDVSPLLGGGTGVVDSAARDGVFEVVSGSFEEDGVGCAVATFSLPGVEASELLSEDFNSSSFVLIAGDDLESILGTFSRLLTTIPSSSLSFADTALDEVGGFSFSMMVLTIGERGRRGDRGRLLTGDRGRGER
jgi:hypothetical protein